MGWRSAIIQKYDGTRSRQTFMFPWEHCGRPWWQVKQDLSKDLKKFIINLFT